MDIRHDCTKDRTTGGLKFFPFCVNAAVEFVESIHISNLSWKTCNLVAGDVHLYVFWKTFHPWYALVAEKPNTEVDVEGIVPKDLIMQPKSPVKCYQIVCEGLLQGTQLNWWFHTNYQEISPSISWIFSDVACAVSIAPHMKCMPFTRLHPCDFPKSNNLQPFNRLCVINWS